jgi:enoyl-CoA hydratase/carnithine racemase
MGFQDIVVDRVERVGWIEINRPDVANALRLDTMREICAALDALEADPSVGAIALIGRGRHFAAGGDFELLHSLRDTPPVDVRDQLYAHFQGVTRRLHRSVKPTLAAVAGAAVTVGAEIALACDVRVGTPDARFDEGWIRIGLMPPLGGAMLLPRIVGMTAAKEMILESRVVSGAEALQLGLLNEIVEPDRLRARVQERAAAMAALPAHAFRAAKEAIHRGIESTMEHEWAANVLAQSLLLSSNDFAACLEERAPPRP